MPKFTKVKIVTISLVAISLLGVGTQNWQQQAEKSKDTANGPKADTLAHLHAGDLARRINQLDLSGHVGLKFNPDKRTADLWLSGEQSKELLAVIGDSKGFTVNLRKSPHSAGQLDKAIEKINKLVRGSAIPGGVVLSSSAKREDGSGIDLTIDKKSQVPDEKWIQSFSDYLKIPVFVDPIKTDIAPTSTRIQDSSPWRGGSLFATTGVTGKTVYCSRGFGVISKTTKIQYMLAARHCFKEKNQTLRTFKNRSIMGFWMPKSYYNSEANDVSLTIPSLGVVRNSVYYGDITTSKAYQVKSVGVNSVGLRVCTNGANSGLHCNVVIRKGPHQVYAGDVIYKNVVTGSKDNNQVVVSQGDSGGPVVSAVNSSGTLQGFGIIHSLSLATDCASNGVRVNVGPSNCGRQVYWIDLSAALKDLHMELK